jgi:histidinol dehydrogenase
MRTERPIRFTGPFSDLSSADKALILDRTASLESSVQVTVSNIISRVRRDGDQALRELAIELDRVELTDLEVPRARRVEALDSLAPDLRKAMERSARNIRAFHEFQRPAMSSITIEPGITLGRRPDPFDRVGIYAPGGRAAYPSSVLMGAVPAKVAGVGEVILCTPPVAGGLPAASVMAAAQLSGVDRVFAIGGAGAIAAMCLGTATIPRADKVVGPGNAYVAEAKLQLATAAAFDSPAGPSELLLIADETADPEAVTREVLAQAEHDPNAIVIVVAIGEDVAGRIEATISSKISSARRSEIIAESLSTRGGVVSVASRKEAVEISNAFAPEHLLIATSSSSEMLEQIRNAGTVFLGESSSVAFGDYMTGANHVLPTGGLAHSYSGLSALDFIRWTTFQTVTPDAAAAMARDVSVFADAEGLNAHGAASIAWAGDSP